MNTCDHYNYVKTKAYAESLKGTCLQTCVCDSYNLCIFFKPWSGDKTFATVKKDSPLKSSALHNLSC